MTAAPMHIELFYWPTIQGRGEFVRLLLEEAGADYVDVARTKKGMPAMMAVLQGEEKGALPYAAPFVRIGEMIVSQSSNILAFLAPKLGLVPADEVLRTEAHQIQLTIADLVAETHDVHHPIGVSLYYEDQKREAKRRAGPFVKERIPKFLRWLESILERNANSGGAWLVGSDFSYVDLSAFQLVEGLRYAFPRAMAQLGPTLPRLFALRDNVAARPRVAAYLKSKRRLPFNREGIFRLYPELDATPARRKAKKNGAAKKSAKVAKSGKTKRKSA
jgi:glutathione S-transferase